ncbi:MAG: IS110 family transposase [Coriobacteriia bacterium]|jgi:transposase|nr:IS110 family transposase [Coriobacteriia bacterium]
MAIYIGFDVHSQHTTYHVLNERKEKVCKGRIPTQAPALMQFSCEMLALDSEVHVAMESGGQSRWVTRTLLDNGLDAHVFHATEVAAKRPKKEYKNDENDAKDLAHGMLQGMYEMEVYIPTDEAQQMRQNTVQRQHFVEMRSLSQVLAKALLRARSLPVPKCLDSIKAWERLLKEHAGMGDLGFFLELHYQSYVHAEKMVDLIEARMRQTCEVSTGVNEDIELLTSIPGVGFVTAYALVGVIGELTRFPSAAQLSSYLGVVPRSYDSGNRRQAGHITRSGPWYMRKLLCQCAHQARKGSNPLAAYFYSVQGRSGSAKKAIVAVMHRIVRIGFQLLKTRKRFDSGHLKIHSELDPKTGKVFWRMGSAAEPRRRNADPGATSVNAVAGNDS